MRRGGVLMLGLLAALALPAGAALPHAPGQAPGYPSEAGIQPPLARLGATVIYHGRVRVPAGTDLRWELPRSGGAFEWGPPRARRLPEYEGSMGRAPAAKLPATMEVEIPLQVFTLGYVSVPGLGFQVRGTNGAWRRGRLPVARLGVVPVIPPGDTSAQLRPLRGPLAAPWWERVPWALVAGVVGLAAGVVFVIRRLRRRRPAPAAAAVAQRAARSAETVALEALAALRVLRLPEQGRYAEHALRLTAILRRFLEASGAAVLPGDSTPELIGHLDSASLGPAVLAHLSELLGAWDRVKFARAASGMDEARRAEAAVEDLVRRRSAAAPGGAD